MQRPFLLTVVAARIELVLGEHAFRLIPAGAILDQMAKVPATLRRPPQGDAHAAMRAPETRVVGAELVLLRRAQQIQLTDFPMKKFRGDVDFAGTPVAYFLNEALFNNLGELRKV